MSGQDLVDLHSLSLHSLLPMKFTHVKRLSIAKSCPPLVCIMLPICNERSGSLSRFWLRNDESDAGESLQLSTRQQIPAYASDIMALSQRKRYTDSLSRDSTT
ncbi:hypothetical protein M407DRAFT_246662 [Tulasnella calospora MUT 4182]|uniref:Uncharacterized protein n=1 Tax=Tulasnella calospora MUT 4182 TaxID=1051891 RepID=A0A0C3L863_9AGAM|nr:hypothetical protein M407DRAFT_246662 [Tulasnella calospora MUT 4182]